MSAAADDKWIKDNGQGDWLAAGEDPVLTFCDDLDDADADDVLDAEYKDFVSICDLCEIGWGCTCYAIAPSWVPDVCNSACGLFRVLLSSLVFLVAVFCSIYISDGPWRFFLFSSVPSPSLYTRGFDCSL